MNAFKIFDAYSLRARLFPALFASASLIAALATLVPWDRLSWMHAIAGSAVPVILFIAADIARRAGKSTENGYYKKWGGVPTTRMLRHRDDTLDADTKKAYLAFVAGKIAMLAPTLEEETANPAKADAFYERCTRWLRENTRDSKKFALLFNENVTYGYRRNLLALKRFALATDVLLFIAPAIALAYFRPEVESQIAVKLFILMGAAAIHGILVAVAVSEQALKDAADTYARQLLLCCETLAAGHPPKMSRAKRRAS